MGGTLHLDGVGHRGAPRREHTCSPAAGMQVGPEQEVIPLAEGDAQSPQSALYPRPLASSTPAPLLPCVPASWCLGMLLGARATCPGAPISDLCAIGGGSHSGLGWGWALLVYWRHFCGMSCDVMVLGWCMFGALVGGLLVGACVVVGWIPMLSLQHVLHVLRTHKLSNAVRRLRRSGLAEPHTRPIEAQ